MSAQSAQLRLLMERKGVILRPGVALAIHAKMAEAQGYEVVCISGSALSTHVFGLPDAGLITQSEVVENARRVCAAVRIPVIVDCDTGFGNAINVRRTVAEIIRSGAAGMHLEDQVAPKRCGFVVGKQILSVEEAEGKIRAACDMRDELNRDFVIIARTDARTAVGGSLDEVLVRAECYTAAGADVIYIEALQSHEEMAQVRARFGGKVMFSTLAISPTPTLEELSALGSIMTTGAMFFKSGLITMWDMLADMKKRGLAPYNEYLEQYKDHPMGGLGGFDLVGFPELAQLEAKYLPPEEFDKYSTSLGTYNPLARKTGERID